MAETATLLDQTLQEEKRTDELLTRIAESAANEEAGEGEPQDDEEDEEKPARRATRSAGGGSGRKSA
jgi:Domain of unknown function (DUF892)